MRKKFAFGANMPPSVKFMQDAAWHIVHESKTREEILVLAEAIAQVKLGELEIPIGTTLTVEEYLASHQNGRNFAYGALPPEEAGWQIGKTAASISFVHDAENYLNDYSENSEGFAIIADAIIKIKEGKLILESWKTPEEYLKEQKSGNS